MSASNKWIIRDAGGRIEGPFSTEKVLYKIGRGEFSGDESVAMEAEVEVYPRGLGRGYRPDGEEGQQRHRPPATRSAGDGPHHSLVLMLRRKERGSK